MSAAITDTNFTPPPLPAPFTSASNPPLLLTQGAEAHLYKSYFLTLSTPAALKIRPSKPYRHAILDRRLTRQRILQEARCLAKAVREGVRVPGVLALDWEGDGDGKVAGESGNGGAWMLMEWIEGVVVRQAIDSWEKWIKAQERKYQEGAEDNEAAIKSAENDMHALLRKIGLAVGAMHKAGIIHGDLTTSNLMLRPTNPIQEATTGALDTTQSEIQPSLDGEIVLIDFGLAGQSTQEEDRAVDLYVLERAFGSSHPRTEGLFEDVIQAYRESYKGADVVLRKLQAVRMRGRKRSMVG